MSHALKIVACAGVWASVARCATGYHDPAHTLRRFGDEMRRLPRQIQSAGAECHLSNSQCSFSGLTRDQPTLIHPGGSTRCLSSERPEYRFQVLPGDNDKLVLYFQGGGVCWSEATSRFSCFQEAMPDTQGIFSRGDATNPFQRYSIVDVLYCSGDAHMGMVNNSWGPQSGWANTESALNWALANFPAVSSLVIAGSSAGSLGTQLMAQYILRKFDGRYASASVIADSVADVTPPTIQPTLTRQFNFCETPPVKELGVEATCRAGKLSIQDVYVDAMQAFPHVAFASIQSKTDIVQILFWDLWVDVERTRDRNIEGIRFLTLVNHNFQRFNMQPNYVSYLANGAHHVFLEKRALFTADPSGELGCGLVFRPTVKAWVRDLVMARPSVCSVCIGIRYPSSRWGRGLVGVLYCDSEQSGKKLNLTRRAGQ